MGPGNWYAPDPALEALAARRLARMDELIKAGRVIKIIRPDDSLDGKWEAVWSGGHVWVDSYSELCERMRQELGIDAPE